MAEDSPKELFEFFQKMWNPMSFPIPGMFQPTMSVEEVEKKYRGAAVGRELAENEPDLRADDREDPGAAEVGALQVDPGICRGDLTERPKETERRRARNKDLAGNHESWVRGDSAYPCSAPFHAVFCIAAIPSGL